MDDLRWYRVVPHHKYANVSTEDPRWSCDVASGECVQNVVYDACDSITWEQAATSQHECIAESATNPEAVSCARYACNTEVPFDCIYYNTGMNDKDGNPPPLHAEANCGNCNLEYNCKDGLCVAAALGEPGEFKDFLDCQVACRRYNCEINKELHTSDCNPTKNYGDVGISKENCTKMCSLQRFTCTSDGGAPYCTQSVEYGSANYADAAASMEECEKTCSTTKFSCTNNQCVASPTGEYGTVNACWDASCGAWGCVNGSCSAVSPKQGGPIWYSESDCQAHGACDISYECSGSFCVPVKSAGVPGISFTECSVGCGTANMYTCDAMSGTCVLDATGNGTQSFSTCSQGCTAATYTAIPSGIEGVPGWCLESMGASSAQDCMRQAGYSNVLEDSASVFASPTLFTYDKAKHIFESKYIGMVFNLASGQVGANDVPVNDLAESSVEGADIFRPDLLVYTPDPSRQSSIVGRRLFETQSSASTFESMTEYQQNISTNVNASFGFNAGLFSCQSEVNRQMKTTLDMSQDVKASRIDITITDAMFSIDLSVLEYWSSLHPDFQTSLLKFASPSYQTEANVRVFTRKWGTHLVTRLMLGKQFMNAVHTTQTKTATSSDLTEAACGSAGYASKFSASACNNKSESSSSEVASIAKTYNIIIRGGYPPGTGTGRPGYSSNDSSANQAMWLLMFENAPMSTDVATNYNYMFLPVLVKNIARKIQDPKLRYSVLLANDYLTNNLVDGANRITTLWEEHRSGKRLAHQHHDWPQWYDGWKITVERYYQSASPKRWRIQDDASWYSCVMGICEEDVQGTMSLEACLASGCSEPGAYDCDESTQTCTPNGTQYRSKGDCVQACSKYTCDATTGECNVDPTSTLSYLQCSTQCAPPSWKYTCSGEVCIQTETGTQSYEYCSENCGNWSCRPDILACTRDPIGAYDDKSTCDTACNTWKPTPSMCPQGKRCVFVGDMFVIADNSLSKPDNARSFFHNALLAVNSEGSCVTSKLATGNTSILNNFFSNTADYSKSESTSTNVSASCAKGNNNFGASGGRSSSQSMKTHADVAVLTMDSVAQVGQYNIDYDQSPICQTLGAINPDVIYALLSLPPIALWANTQNVVPSISLGRDYLTPQMYEAFDFAYNYGSHVATQVNLGFQLNLMNSTANTSSETEDTLSYNACVGGSGTSWNASACGGKSSSTSTYNSSLYIGTQRNVIGGDGVVRGLVVNPTTPNTSMVMAQLNNSAPIYVQPVDADVPIQYDSIWNIILNMYVKATIEDQTINSVMWTQLLTKCVELCLGYNSRWCITDVAKGATQPIPTFGSDGLPGMWVKVRFADCGQPPSVKYNPLNGAAPNYQIFINASGDPYSCADNITFLSGYPALMPTTCNFLWAKWELVALPLSYKPILTAVASTTNNTTPPSSSCSNGEAQQCAGTGQWYCCGNSQCAGAASCNTSNLEYCACSPPTGNALFTRIIQGSGTIAWLPQPGDVYPGKCIYVANHSNAGEGVWYCQSDYSDLYATFSFECANTVFGGTNHNGTSGSYVGSLSFLETAENYAPAKGVSWPNYIDEPTQWPTYVQYLTNPVSASSPFQCAGPNGNAMTMSVVPMYIGTGDQFKQWAGAQYLAIGTTSVAYGSGQFAIGSSLEWNQLLSGVLSIFPGANTVNIEDSVSSFENGNGGLPLLFDIAEACSVIGIIDSGQIAQMVVDSCGHGFATINGTVYPLTVTFFMELVLQFTVNGFPVPVGGVSIDASATTTIAFSVFPTTTGQPPQVVAVAYKTVDPNFTNQSSANNLMVPVNVDVFLVPYSTSTFYVYANTPPSAVGMNFYSYENVISTSLLNWAQPTVTFTTSSILLPGQITYGLYVPDATTGLPTTIATLASFQVAPMQTFYAYAYSIGPMLTPTVIQTGQLQPGPNTGQSVVAGTTLPPNTTTMANANSFYPLAASAPYMFSPPCQSTSYCITNGMTYGCCGMPSNAAYDQCKDNGSGLQSCASTYPVACPGTQPPHQNYCPDNGTYYCCSNPTCNLTQSCPSNANLSACACPTLSPQ